MNDNCNTHQNPRSQVACRLHWHQCQSNRHHTLVSIFLRNTAPPLLFCYLHHQPDEWVWLLSNLNKCQIHQHHSWILAYIITLWTHMIQEHTRLVEFWHPPTGGSVGPVAVVGWGDVALVDGNGVLVGKLISVDGTPVEIVTDGGGVVGLMVTTELRDRILNMAHVSSF